MKKLSKLFLSCAAVAAVTAAVATSAMAAGEVSATYTPAADGATTASLKITTNYTADQKTLLIVPSSVTLDKVSADDVVQIDQNADIVDVVLPANLKDGKYTVYMGGDGQVPPWASVICFTIRSPMIWMSPSGLSPSLRYRQTSRGIPMPLS